MDELQELLRQRKEINERISALQNQLVSVDGARLERNPSASYGLYWRVCVKNDEQKKGVQWRTVVNANTRENAVIKLGNVIKDLEELYEKVKCE